MEATKINSKVILFWEKNILMTIIDKGVILIGRNSYKLMRKITHLPIQ